MNILSSATHPSVHLVNLDSGRGRWCKSSSMLRFRQDGVSEINFVAVLTSLQAEYTKTLSAGQEELWEKLRCRTTAWPFKALAAGTITYGKCRNQLLLSRPVQFFRFWRAHASLEANAVVWSM